VIFKKTLIYSVWRTRFTFFETVEEGRVHSCFKKRLRLAKRNNCAFPKGSLISASSSCAAHKSVCAIFCIKHLQSLGVLNLRTNAQPHSGFIRNKKGKRKGVLQAWIIAVRLRVKKKVQNLNAMWYKEFAKNFATQGDFGHESP